MKDNKKKMSNESILLCAVEQSLLEERALMPPNKRDGWELTAAGTSTPTLSEEIKDFWKPNRIQLKKQGVSLWSSV